MEASRSEHSVELARSREQVSHTPSFPSHNNRDPYAYDFDQEQSRGFQKHETEFNRIPEFGGRGGVVVEVRNHSEV